MANQGKQFPSKNIKHCSDLSPKPFKQNLEACIIESSVKIFEWKIEGFGTLRGRGSGRGSQEIDGGLDDNGGGIGTEESAGVEGGDHEEERHHRQLHRSRHRRLFFPPFVDQDQSDWVVSLSLSLSLSLFSLVFRVRIS